MIENSTNKIKCPYCSMSFETSKYSHGLTAKHKLAIHKGRYHKDIGFGK